VPLIGDEPSIPKEIEEKISELPRSPMPEADLSERIHDFREVELGFADEAARLEAGRCLRCDIEV